jgi:hypothetical protein
MFIFLLPIALSGSSSSRAIPKLFGSIQLMSYNALSLGKSLTLPITGVIKTVGRFYDRIFHKGTQLVLSPASNETSNATEELSTALLEADSESQVKGVPLEQQSPGKPLNTGIVPVAAVPTVKAAAPARVEEPNPVDLL